MSNNNNENKNFYIKSIGLINAIINYTREIKAPRIEYYKKVIIEPLDNSYLSEGFNCMKDVIFKSEGVVETLEKLVPNIISFNDVIRLEPGTKMVKKEDGHYGYIRTLNKYTHMNSVLSIYIRDYMVNPKWMLEEFQGFKFVCNISLDKYFDLNLFKKPGRTVRAVPNVEEKYASIFVKDQR